MNQIRPAMPSNCPDLRIQDFPTARIVVRRQSSSVVTPKYFNVEAAATRASAATTETVVDPSSHTIAYNHHQIGIVARPSCDIMAFESSAFMI